MREEEQGRSICEHFDYHGRKTLMKNILVNRVNLRSNERLVRVDFLHRHSRYVVYVFVNIRFVHTKIDDVNGNRGLNW